ncbi:hypothetical protein GGR42_000588 [Saonia flava]|uniref:Uncharacterized protein n=1 Tax=Saonia flava TaxID=523696 RepID=A0A846QMC1_9FLAO|nr:hypothetical protein [Saonia flava]NJB70126.1 hypothetical protein [Saonia flava]
MVNVKKLDYNLMFPLKSGKPNLYWPVYENLEKEFTQLSFNIFIDDNQLDTYSYKISELILRSAIEIESISKELYYREGGKEVNNLRYDDALKYLDKKWKLNKKLLMINSPNLHVSETKLRPFSKTLNKRNRKMQFRWNIAYQNIKHNRGKFVKEASIKNLLDILSALFVLNIYYNDEMFDLGKDSRGKSLYSKLSTSLFAVSIHRNEGLNQFEEQNRRDGFEESLYYIVFDDQSRNRLRKAMKDWVKRMKDKLPNEPEFDKFRKMENLFEFYSNAEIEEKIGKESLKNLIATSSLGLPKIMEGLTSVAKVNKNDL